VQREDVALNKRLCEAWRRRKKGVDEDMKGNFVDTDEITDLAAGITELREKVNLRDKTCGAMYRNILNDDACLIANKCLELGGNRSQIEELLGEGNFRG
jgi:hypothetical protein